MKPLIVVATNGEIAPSINFLTQMDIPYLITGVGMVATAYQLGKVLQDTRPDYVLNIGIAGAFSKTIPLGTVIQTKTDHLSELGAENGDIFIPIEGLGFGRSVFHSTSPSQLSVQLPSYHGITVNTVHGNPISIDQIRERLPLVATESMEGAAVFFVCQEEKVPCLQVRAISNYVEKRDRSTWDIALAIENLNLWLQEFLK